MTSSLGFYELSPDFLSGLRNTRIVVETDGNPIPRLSFTTDEVADAIQLHYYFMQYAPEQELHNLANVTFNVSKNGDGSCCLKIQKTAGGHVLKL